MQIHKKYILRKEKILILSISAVAGILFGTVKGYILFMENSAPEASFIFAIVFFTSILLYILLSRPEHQTWAIYGLASMAFILQLIHFKISSLSTEHAALFTIYPLLYFLLFGFPEGLYWSISLLAGCIISYFAFGSSESSLFPLILIFSINIMLFAFYTIEINKKHEIISGFSEMDPLTSLLNRGAFLPILDNEIKRMKRNPEIHSLTSVIISINDFENINDVHGQNAADKILIELSELIKDWLRVEDTLARWSGGEFIVIFRETDTEHAKHVVEKLHDKIEKHRFDYINRISCSFGISSFNKDEQRNDFLNRVEKALEKARQNTHPAAIAVV